MFQIGIIDDAEFDQNKLVSSLLHYEEEKGVSFDIHTFSSGEAYLASDLKNFDLLFLDIAMKGMDGMETARQIRKEDSKVLLIFVTSMLQYAVEGYSVDALDFIVKPVSYEAVKLRMDRAMTRLLPSFTKHLEIKTGDGVHMINASDVYYVESYNHKVRLHTKDQVLPVNQSMLAMEKEFEGLPFFRCHASFLINFNYVERIQGMDIWVGGDQLAISRQKKKEFLDAWSAFLGGNQ